MAALRNELIDLVETVAPSVVTVRKASADLKGGSGSGWCYGIGLVITNAHVVDGVSPSFKLRLRGGALVPAQLVGADDATDLAVLRTDAVLPVLDLRGHPARLGEPCFAFGSPLGEFPETVTFGIVSGLDRRLPQADGWSIEGVIQTDAEINPGNSGGPLVDLDGQVLGVNSAIRVDGRGVGFSVPATTICSIVPELVQHGAVLRPRLGVAIDVIEHRSEDVERERLRVASVQTTSPFQRGDVLVSIAGQVVETRGDLFSVLRRHLLGTPTSVVVEREGQHVQFEVECKAP